MNEFAAKKLGEVLAFAVVGAETVERGKEALTETLGDQAVSNYLTKAAEHEQKLNQIGQDYDAYDTMQARAGSTSDKLRQMRDSYLQERWDDAAELMEWLGFFEGAAIVHWKLVEGVGKHRDIAEILDTANDAVTFHQETLSKIGESIEEVGKSRS